MARVKHDMSPRIENRKVFHDYFVDDRLECGIVLLGSEVKSLRNGTAQIAEGFAVVDHGQLVLHNCHIEPYKQSAIVYNHQPRRPRRLLAHRREIKRLVEALSKGGSTLVPLSIYFKDGRAKVELGLVRGKKSHDKRDTIRQKESDRELRRAMTRRL
jgi:SsrA-binding protein